MPGSKKAKDGWNTEAKLLRMVGTDKIALGAIGWNSSFHSLAKSENGQKILGEGKSKSAAKMVP